MVEISVIVPVYKVERYLCECIDSILQQTFREFELILIDDGSPDRCGQICDEYAKADDRVRVIHQKNGGLSAARNAGLDLADGEFITFVDSDDILNRYYLQKLYEALTEYNADVAVCDSCNIVHKEDFQCPVTDRTTPCILMGHIEAVKSIYQYDKEQLPITVWGKLYKKELFANLRFPVGMIHEDEYLTPRLLYLSKRVIWIRQALYGYRQREESTMNRKFSIIRYDGIKAVDMCIEYFKSISEMEIAEVMKNRRNEIVAYFSFLARGAGIYRNVPVEYRMSRIRAIRTMRALLPYDLYAYRIAKFYPWYISAEAYIRRLLQFLGKRCMPKALKKRIVSYINYPQLRKVVIRKDAFRYYAIRRKLFSDREKRGISNIPVFIISFNRLSYLKNMISHLETLGVSNIIVIDNASTYPPLLEYYDNIPYKVIRLDRNWGHKVFWDNPIFDEYRQDFYVVTDPDLEPIKGCPKNFMEVFFNVLKRYPYVRKVGFSLRIDDIPGDSVLHDEVLEWEKQFYEHYLPGDNIYIAFIDTTFALYVPDQLVFENMNFLTAYRTGLPYQCRHLPWYKTHNDVDEEDMFYSALKLQTTGNWDVAAGTSDIEEI